MTGVWTSFAQEEKIDWWIRRLATRWPNAPSMKSPSAPTTPAKLLWIKAPAGANLLSSSLPRFQPDQALPPGRVITRLATA